MFTFFSMFYNTKIAICLIVTSKSSRYGMVMKTY